MPVLGISAYDRESAAALVVDGEIVSAVQEKRLLSKTGKHQLVRHRPNCVL
ncbi:hypothetical protein [Microcoleus sp. F4-D5]|uniref:hypothetical protein n=1 Tax=Microcoleus sp. F4-D5 TaxID=2818760 RepID=UPI002FCF1D8E